VPRPPGLERDVQFWVRVYTEVDTNSGFLHDEHDLAVVYETLHFAPNTPPHEREKTVESARDRYSAALRRIAAASGELAAEDQRIKDMWGAEGTPSRLLEATQGIRFQLGQADRFREGLVRSGAWQTHIAETFASLGLPRELAVLPHVESSFNPAAYSKVGAAGLWQFMRSTGRRYMRIDSSVDDRLDPFRSTEAAAQLLAYNYRLLGTWPLALTAYNHGAAGMRRARDSLGTEDIEHIVRQYKSPTFGFASRNFYVSFLAALEIDSHPEKYFGNFKPLGEVTFREIVCPAFVPLAALERALKIDVDKLRALNPALRPAVWNGQRHIPKGYHLRLPADGEKWTSELLAQRLNPREVFAAQPQERRYRVRSHETLAAIAVKYDVSTQTLAQLNGINIGTKLRAGRSLLVPSAQPVTVAAATLAAAPAATLGAPPATAPGRPPATAPGAPGAMSAAAPPTGPGAPRAPSAPSVAAPGALPATASTRPATPPSAPPATAPSAKPTPAPAVAARAGGAAPSIRVAVASTAAPGGVPAAQAERESAEDAEAVARIGKPAARAEPVSASQAEAISPALGPAVETPQTADPIDYSVTKDGVLTVVADETLGHYALVGRC
jgi:membrane-bound lytic murein transglycosylase D